MLGTQDSMHHRAQRLILAVCLPMLITACESNDSPLLDLDSIFPPGTVTPANENTASTDGMLMEQNADSTNELSNETADEQNTTPQGDESNNAITPELARLTRGPILFESSFNGTAEPIRDIFQFTSADYQAFPDNMGLLSIQSGDTISVCAYATETAQYFCLRSFLDTNDRVWHVFNLQSATNGAGFFEFCDDNVTDEECRTKLFNNPDGTDTVTITPLNASISLPNAFPYFAYAEQGTQSPRSSTAAVGEYDQNTMNILVTMADHSAGYW